MLRIFSGWTHTIHTNEGLLQSFPKVFSKKADIPFGHTSAIAPLMPYFFKKLSANNIKKRQFVGLRSWTGQLLCHQAAEPSHPSSRRAPSQPLLHPLPVETGGRSKKRRSRELS